MTELLKFISESITNYAIFVTFLIILYFFIASVVALFIEAMKQTVTYVMSAVLQVIGFDKTKQQSLDTEQK